MLEFILQAVTRPVDLDAFGRDMMHDAVNSLCLPSLELLLNYGINPVSSDNHGATPLHLAVLKGSDEMVKALVHHGAKLESRAEDGSTPLLVAGLSQHLSTVQLLVSLGASAKARNANGQTGLHFAVLGNNLAMAKFFLENEADVNAQARLWSTAMHLAAFLGFNDLIKLMIDHGALADVQYRFEGEGYQTLRSYDNSLAWYWEDYRALRVQYEIEEGFTPLHSAVFGGHDDTVQILLDVVDDVSSKTLTGQTPLHIAASCSHLSTVKLLLKHKAGINVKDQSGETVLHSACRLKLTHAIANSTTKSRCDCSRHMATEGNLAKNLNKGIIDALLSAGGDPYVQNDEGQTPLECAAMAKNEEAVRALTRYHSSKSRPASISATSLHEIAKANAAAGESTILYLMSAYIDKSLQSSEIWNDIVDIACCNKKAQVLQLALRKDVELSAAANLNLLHRAIAIRDAWLVKLLLKVGANCDEVNPGGRNALHVACEHVGQTWRFGGRSRAIIAKMIIPKCRNINARTSEGDTALHLAVSTADCELVATLLQFGASVKIRNKHQDTALHKAFTQFRDDSIINLLLQYDASTSAQNKRGETALHMAIASEEGVTRVDHLLVYGADVSIKDESGQTALHLAASRGDWEVANLLILHGAAATETDEDGYTPLHIAAWKGHTPLFQLLVDNGADVEARTITLELSALELSTQHKQYTSMQWLLSRTRNVNDQTSRNSRTLLHLAVSPYHGEPSIKAIELLLAAGANPNLMDRFQMTPLQIAVEDREYEIAEALCNAGADPNILTKMSNPVAAAVENHDLAMLELLLTFGARIDGPFAWTILDKESVDDVYEGSGKDVEVSPLYVTACHWNLSGAKILLSKGANFHILADTIRTHFPPRDDQAYYPTPEVTENERSEIVEVNSIRDDDDNESFYSRQGAPVRPARPWTCINDLAEPPMEIDISQFSTEDTDTVNEYLSRLPRSTSILSLVSSEALYTNRKVVPKVWNPASGAFVLDEAAFWKSYREDQTPEARSTTNYRTSDRPRRVAYETDSEDGEGQGFDVAQFRNLRIAPLKDTEWHL